MWCLEVDSAFSSVFWFIHYKNISTRMNLSLALVFLVSVVVLQYRGLSANLFISFTLKKVGPKSC